jgi:hypothetical protein
VALTADGDERGLVVATQVGRQLVDGEADVVVGQPHAVELGPVAAGHEVGDDLGEPGVERGPGQQARGGARGHHDLVGVRAPEVVGVLGVVDLDDRAHVRRHGLDRHHDQDRAQVGRVGGRGRADDRHLRVADAGAVEVDHVGDVAPDEVDTGPRRVPLAVVEHHDPALVVLTGQPGDQVARGGVPPADDDVAAVARCTHALSLLEQVVDHEARQRPGDRRHPQPCPARVHGGPDCPGSPAHLHRPEVLSSRRSGPCVG